MLLLVVRQVKAFLKKQPNWVFFGAWVIGFNLFDFTIIQKK
jgi:hypothetical protein